MRNIKWTVDNMMNFLYKLDHKPVKAVIEHVRDGSTVRAFLLPEAGSQDFTYVTLMMCGIRVSLYLLINLRTNFLNRQVILNFVFVSVRPTSLTAMVNLTRLR